MSSQDLNEYRSKVADIFAEEFDQLRSDSAFQGTQEDLEYLKASIDMGFDVDSDSLEVRNLVERSAEKQVRGGAELNTFDFSLVYADDLCDMVLHGSNIMKDNDGLADINTFNHSDAASGRTNNNNDGNEEQMGMWAKSTIIRDQKKESSLPIHACISKY
mmetsp:Transcript_31833/g.49958  ORF Transcript_31833/g.49958 Transcript_31833/m.49958 type:complete len:160 (+) Transcript_31833:37-516(+)